MSNLNPPAQAGDEPMRAAFEAAYCKQYPVIAHISPDKFKRDEYGDYIEGAIFVGWDMYRAGLVSPRATADVERDKETNTLRTWLSYALRQSECDMVLTGEECRMISAVLATTKPGA